MRWNSGGVNMPMARTNRALLPCAVALLVLIFFALSLGAAPQESAAAFEQANKLYEQGKFKGAAAAYEAVRQIS